MTLVFATHNRHKLMEVKQLLPNVFELLSLDEINCNEDIPETAKTLEGNAQLKADYIFKNYKLNCFADDTGLEVTALNGAPGVYSARYAGELSNNEKNIDKLLRELEGNPLRDAQFRTVIALRLNGQLHLFEGIIKGKITRERKGDKGFGYDPVFIPDGYDKTFAELPLEVKNSISHRGKAVKKLVEFLSQL